MSDGGRVTQQDLFTMVERMRREGKDIDIDSAYGQYAITNRKGNRLLSPRLPKRELRNWLLAYIEGYNSARKGGGY